MKQHLVLSSRLSRFQLQGQLLPELQAPLCEGASCSACREYRRARECVGNGRKALPGLLVIWSTEFRWTSDSNMGDMVTSE